MLLDCPILGIKKLCPLLKGNILQNDFRVYRDVTDRKTVRKKKRFKNSRGHKYALATSDNKAHFNDLLPPSSFVWPFFLYKGHKLWIGVVATM